MPLQKRPPEGAVGRCPAGFALDSGLKSRMRTAVRFVRIGDFGVRRSERQLPYQPLAPQTRPDPDLPRLLPRLHRGCTGGVQGVTWGMTGNSLEFRPVSR